MTQSRTSVKTTNSSRFSKAMAVSFVVHGALAAAIIGLIGGVSTRRASTELQIELAMQAPQNTQGESRDADGQDALQRKHEEEKRRQEALAKAARALLSKSDSLKKTNEAPTTLPPEVPAEPSLGQDIAPSSASSAQAADTGAAGNVVAASDAVAADAWLQVQMLDWLDRHKTYPRAAKREHIEGVVQVRFTVSADGVLEQATMEKSSGHQILDRAAMSLLDRAAPFPISLRDFGLTRLEFSLPIAYRLTEVLKG